MGVPPVNAKQTPEEAQSELTVQFGKAQSWAEYDAIGFCIDNSKALQTDENYTELLSVENRIEQIAGPRQ